MKNNVRTLGGVPIIQKKTSRTEEAIREELLNSPMTRREIIDNIITPKKALDTLFMVNISALVTALVEKGVLTEEEFCIALDKAETTLQEGQRNASKENEQETGRENS